MSESVEMTGKRIVKLDVMLVEGVSRSEVDRVVAALIGDPAVSWVHNHERDEMKCPKCGTVRVDWTDNTQSCIPCFMAEADAANENPWQGDGDE
jgi:hypothetical protein